MIFHFYMVLQCWLSQIVMPVFSHGWSKAQLVLQGISHSLQCLAWRRKKKRIVLEMEKNRRVWKPESHIFLLIIKCLLIYVPTGCSSQAPQLNMSKNWTHVSCFSVYISVRNTNSLEPSDWGRDTGAGKPGVKLSLTLMEPRDGHLHLSFASLICLMPLLLPLRMDLSYYSRTLCPIQTGWPMAGSPQHCLQDILHEKSSDHPR